jgi:hypothetical protein
MDSWAGVVRWPWLWGLAAALACWLACCRLKVLGRSHFTHTFLKLTSATLLYTQIFLIDYTSY